MADNVLSIQVGDDPEKEKEVLEKIKVLYSEHQGLEQYFMPIINHTNDITIETINDAKFNKLVSYIDHELAELQGAYIPQDMTEGRVHAAKIKLLQNILKKAEEIEDGKEV